MRRYSVLALALASLIPLAAQAQPAAIDWRQARTLGVTMRDYRFAPPRLRLKRGVPYRLRFVNRSRSEWHEFTAPDFLKTVALGNPNALDRKHAELAVPPGQTRDLYLVPQTVGDFGFYCSDHDWAGMEGSLKVE